MTGIEKAQEKFAKLIEGQLQRIETMAQQNDFIDYNELETIIIGVAGGDGIGPAITQQAKRILEFLLAEEIKSGQVEIKEINGLTIENRAKEGKAIPSSTLEALKQCHVILKGPTTTPRAGDPWPNIESANVAMRKELDLFSNMRPVKVDALGIDWVFFRENTEGGYALGSQGFSVNEDLAFDFTVATTQGARRVIRTAFEYAEKNGKTKVTAVTKANVIKTTDGKFLNLFYEMAKEYPKIQADDWYIDIMTAKLLDAKRRQEFQVFVLPNLYGDILTDEAAEIQGGVGTAGSANIGKQYAMFEAIHGSAPRMVEEGRSQFADPSSIIKAAAMLLTHIGYSEKGGLLSKALHICCETEKKLLMTGRKDGAMSSAFADYIMETIQGLN